MIFVQFLFLLATLPKFKKPPPRIMNATRKLEIFLSHDFQISLNSLHARGFMKKKYFRLIAGRKYKILFL